MAARAFQLISVGSQLIEGIGIQKGEPRPESRISLAVPTTENDPLVHLLQQFDEQLQEVAWQNTPVVLVIPTSEISIRQLDFPFSDPKKIGQALVFELENELLEDVGSFAHDHVILPQPDGTAQVLVYLVSRDYLQALVNVCLARNIVPFRATFSAQALALAHPPASGLHYYLYSGPDETYVACMRGGFCVSTVSFPLDAAALAGGATGEPEASRQELIRQAVSGNGAGAEESGNGKHPLQARLREALASLGGEIEQFLGPDSLGEPFTLSVHGRFGEMLAWDGGTGRLTLAEGHPAAGSAPPGEPFFGGITDFLGDPGAVADSTGVNFHRQSVGLLGQVKEFRKPLIAMGALLAVSLGILLTVGFLRISDANGRLAALEGQAQQILKVHLQGNHGVAEGVRLLEDQVKKNNQGASGARFDPYRYETLEALNAISGAFKAFPNLSLRSLTINSERFTLDGNTDSYDASESLKNRLAGLEIFRGKEPVVTHQKRGDQITFRLIVQR